MDTTKSPEHLHLQHVIRTTPIIDNHAHPLLTLDSIGQYPLLSLTTEAHGDAIHAAMTSLAHIRGVKQLGRLLGLASPTWEGVVNAIEQRRIHDYSEWVRTCLSGIEAVLVDDGLDAEDDVYPYGFFDRVTPSRAKRIVRIEKLAEQVIEEICFGGKNEESDDDDDDNDGEESNMQERSRHAGRSTGASSKELFEQVLQAFSDRITKYIADPEVVGFKSIICYRTGLGIPGQMDPSAAIGPFEQLLAQRPKDVASAMEAGEADTLAPLRLQHPGLNELFVHILAKLIRDLPPSVSSSKPHHGHPLLPKGLNLPTTSSATASGTATPEGAATPSTTPTFFRKPIQFHTGLGDNDIALPRASPAHLQEFIREYPIVPIVLLHASYPFTREAGYLATVYANVYADIGEVFPFVSQDGQEAVVREVLELCPWSKILWSTDGHWFPETYYLATVQMREVLEKVLVSYCLRGHLSWRQAEHLVRDILFHNSNKLYQLRLPFHEIDYLPGSLPRVDSASNAELLQLFLTEAGTTFPPPSFLRIYWVDYSALPRMRAIPLRRVHELLRESDALSIGITKASLGILPNDTVCAGASATGEYRLYPDFSSLRYGPREGHISTWGQFREQNGDLVALCPRTLLSRVLAQAGRQGLNFLIGFEVEFLIMYRDVQADEQTYHRINNDGHAWSVGRAMDNAVADKVIERAISVLASIGIHVEQYHPESAPGQYEVILPKAPPLEAIENLLLARDVISNIATAEGWRMTLHPKPFPDACGTAAHLHMSISSPKGAKPEVYEPFYAGVLKHLRSIAAFTYANPVSYERVVDSAWAGGRWVTWGTQNRETPLRKIEGSHWEVKCNDGLSNPYLAVAALLAAGTKGVIDEEPLVWGDCEVDPANLTDNDKKELGVKEMLPASLDEALKALQADEELVGLLGEEFVERYVAVKTAEMAILKRLSPGDMRQWIMARY